MNKDFDVSLFVDTNGKILRTLNILNSSKCKLKELEFLFDDIGETKEERHQNFKRSVIYLCESECIRISDIETKQNVTLSESNFNNVNIGLTAKGIKLLCGKLTDECIDI